MNEIQLRDYQQECVDIINNTESGSYLVAVATGLGKTVIFSHIARRGRMLILSHREELVWQPKKYFDCSYGVEKADIHSNGEEVVSASVQSLVRRLDSFSPDDFDIIITDEAHHAVAPTYKLTKYEASVIVRNYNIGQSIIKDYEFIVENANRYFELLDADPPTPNHKLSPYRLFLQLIIDSKEKVKSYAKHLEKMKSEFAETQDKYDRAVAEKKEVTAHYSTFIRQTETDYVRYLTSGKKELEAYEESLQKAALEEKRKAEEERERAERQIAEKRMAIEEARQREEAKKRAEERRKRNSYCR